MNLNSQRSNFNEQVTYTNFYVGNEPVVEDVRGRVHFQVEWIENTIVACAVITAQAIEQLAINHP